MFQVANLCNQLPAAEATSFQAAFLNEYSDSMVVTYLASVTKLTTLANEVRAEKDLVTICVLTKMVLPYSGTHSIASAAFMTGGRKVCDDVWREASTARSLINQYQCSYTEAWNVFSAPKDTCMTVPVIWGPAINVQGVQPTGA
jgi:hypothetical protein